MEWWQPGMVANGVIAVAYFLIFSAIILPLVRGKQLRKNPLGTATAAIFLTCAVHHGIHAVHMAMPAFGLDLTYGNAMRSAWTWQLAVWDIIGAVVATYYWTLRRTYGSLMQGAQLFEDMKRREEQALDPLTSQPYTSVVVVDAETDDVPAAVAAAGPNSTVVVDGSKGQLDTTATIVVQDPCHLRHVQRAQGAVRSVLAPAFTLVETDDDGLCCGAGGVYALLQPELAGSIRDRKVAALRRAAPDPVVASANPGCIVHLRQAGIDARHPADLLAAALTEHEHG